MDAESSKRKTSPPFLASIFRFSEGVFISHLREIEVPWHLVRSSLDLEPRVFGFLLIGLKPFWHLFGTYCFLVPKVFWFGPFERSKALCVYFVPVVPSVPKVFGSDLLKGRSPLALILHLLCLLVPKVFGFGPFNRSKPLGVYLASTYCVFGCRRFFLVRTF